jgi:hypothetical protein
MLPPSLVLYQSKDSLSVKVYDSTQVQVAKILDEGEIRMVPAYRPAGRSPVGRAWNHRADQGPFVKDFRYLSVAQLEESSNSLGQLPIIGTIEIFDQAGSREKWHARRDSNSRPTGSKIYP